MRFKILFVLVVALLVGNACMAQSESYKKKKDSALKTTSPFELIAAHQKKEVHLEYEDDELMVFEPVSKQAPVHLLIVPKKRIYTLNEAGTNHQNMLGKMMLLAKEMARKKGIDQTGYRLALNTNEHAGQSVFHIHLHLLGGTKLGPMMDQTVRNNLTAKPGTDKEQIEQLLQLFMTSIEKKDTSTLFSLFVDVPISWVAVWKPETFKELKKTKPNEPLVESRNYKTWVTGLMRDRLYQEKFTNPVISEDGSIGAVTFDYSFWVNDKKGNWGKESWGLIKVNDQWKIASVLFSVEYEKFKSSGNESKDGIAIKHPLAEKHMRLFKDTANFHGTVLIAKGDSVIHHAAYGYFDVENNVPNSVNTQFLIGSLTKSFVAIAIMQLAEKGKIDLHAPLQQYIPALKPELAKDVTIHHLLKQQSGLAASMDNLTEYEIMDITPSELLDIINQSKRNFNPGEKHEYSNINYCLLAMVIEKVTGKSYQNYLQETIFTPVGMTNTGMERLLNIPANRAIGYRMINNQFRRVQNVVSYAYGSGDIYSTAMEIYHWGRALHSGKLVSAESLAKMFNGGTKDWGYYGYGFRIQGYQRSPLLQTPGTLIRHGGTMNGFTSNYHYYKEDDLTIIILSNYRNIPIRTLTYHLKEIILDSEPGKRKNSLAE
ncbi:CubicO group peptidase (beta-lactamase class C family) [Lacibacter cauensis]|uniref:CubicO group peptidase (Beta-lactamase class C family) n=1 Tax=Lacibacter cauensis TaxID=510947 RepID=A0A562SXQ9_9BACT|nr:serine hydrolase [Lacibacter cauensis]TWI85778.1 CubicO group peptidase (beta-lactamase class C family) [Lacibacter cauensis]